MTAESESTQNDRSKTVEEESVSLGVVEQLATEAALTEDMVFAMLKQRDLSPRLLETIAQRASKLKPRKVRMALVSYPQIPRYVAQPLLRTMHTFDLAKLALTPSVPADIKLAANEILIARLETLSCGEKISLARRSSGRLAAALLVDSDIRVSRAALENPRLTEVAIIKAIAGPEPVPGLVQMISEDSTWNARMEVRIALLQNPHTPLAKALEFAGALPPGRLRELLASGCVPEPLIFTFARISRLQAEIDEIPFRAPSRR
jgi:hypothetical protein